MGSNRTQVNTKKSEVKGRRLIKEKMGCKREQDNKRKYGMYRRNQCNTRKDGN